MKNHKIYFVLPALITLLCACGQNDIEQLSTQDTSSTGTSSIGASSPESHPGQTSAEDDSLPPQEGLVHSRLTNEWVDEAVANTRPIAVIIPNEIDALPHYQLADASVLYEANVEGRMSRLMAIYEDWEHLGKIGNIRSLRTYYAYWSFEWDAFLVHYGGPYFVDELIARPDTNNVNGLGGDEAAFFQTQDRSSPHNTYTSGSRILEIVKQKGYSLEYRGLADDCHYRFAPMASPNTLSQYGEDAQNATYIDMSGCYPLTRCYFEYNEDDGLYYRFQHLSGGTDGPHLDAGGNQLTFKNILVQYIKYEELDGGYLVFQCHDSTNDGYYFTNGKGIHVTWKKDSDYGATRYYDDAGNEIALNTGKTMVCVVEEDDSFTYR